MTNLSRRDPSSRGLRVALVAGIGVSALVIPALTSVASTPQHRGPSPAPACKGPAPRMLNGYGHDDQGPGPTVINIQDATVNNNAYRDTLWTGTTLQLTVMSIKPKDDIGLEAHPALDQFIRVEAGYGVVKMGPSQYNLNFVQKVGPNSAIFIPAGTWHDVINASRHSALKVYSIYAPPNHPRNTLHWTKQDAANDPLEKQKCPQDLEAAD